MPRMFMAIRREDRIPIVEIMTRTPPIPENAQWAIFLRNHDELTLEMVTDEERDYMYSEYAKDSMMRRNLGIRRRLAPLLDNSRRKIELMNSLLLSLPGTPVIYYGDEIGMGDNVFLGDRNGVRTPMQWSGDRNAGFSRADAARLYEPVITDPVYGFQAVNVEAQERLPTSLLEWMRRIIRVRKRYRAFGRGSLEFLNADNRTVLAYVRAYARRSAAVRGQPFAVRPTVAARSQRVRRLAADRADRRDAVPADRRAALLPDTRSAQLLLVPVGAPGAGRRMSHRVSHTGATARPPLSDRCSTRRVPRRCRPGWKPAAGLPTRGEASPESAIEDALVERVGSDWLALAVAHVAFSRWDRRLAISCRWH